MANSSSRKPRLAIGAIFKNERPYILEWLAFHQAVGVERFFIADNDSDDGSTPLLAALDRAGQIDHIPFPGRPGEPPQLPAYDEILRRHSGDADWIAFIDADEFLVPDSPGRTPHALLAGLEARKDVGAVAVSWATYGSSGESVAGPEPVIQRFHAHANHDNPINRHYKSIVRTAACRGVASTPHAFRLRPGFRTVHPDGSDVALVNPNLPGLARAVHWSPVRVNHYVVKSREEFENKRRRGRATRLDAPRTEIFFAKHDLNEVSTPMARKWIDAVEAGRKRLLDASEPTGGASAAATRQPAGPIVLPSTPASGDRPQGRVDHFNVTGDVMALRGWALAPGGARMASFFLVTEEGEVVSPIETGRRPRPDVVEKFPGADSRAGFSLTFALDEVGTAAPKLRAIAPDGGVFDQRLPRRGWVATPRIAHVPDAPLMPPPAASAFGEALSGARSYLEYGSGGSTVLALRRGVRALVSVESDQLWHAAVRSRVADRLQPGRHHLQHVDIGPTTRFGYPASEAPWRRFARYPLEPWKLCKEQGLDPDLVLIDGRFRVASLLATLIHASPGCRVLFDDFEDRSAYHPVTAFVQPRRRIDRMAEFVVPRSRQPDAMWTALIDALGDPQ